MALNIKFWKVTDAQYKALPESKLTDNALYFITDKPYIHLNDQVYGVAGVDIAGISSVAYNAATRVMTFTLTNGESKTVTLTLADATNPGLMSSADFTKLSKVDNSLLQKIVTTSIAAAASAADTKLPTEKAVATLCDTVLASATALASAAGHSLTYVADTNDPALMKLSLLNKAGTIISTVNLNKDNFMSNFIQREATQADVTAGHATAVGDPLLEVTMSNGDKFYVDLKGLVDIYKGNATSDKGVIVTVNGYTISAELKIDTAAQATKAVKLVVGANGVSADINIDTAAQNASSAKIVKNATTGALSVNLEWTDVTA